MEVSHLITEAMYAGGSIGQDIHRYNWEAGVIQILTAASFAGIVNCG